MPDDTTEFPAPTGGPYAYGQPTAEPVKQKRSKKHLIGYPVTAIVALMIGSAGGGGTPAPIASPATVTVAGSESTVTVAGPEVTKTVTAAAPKTAAPAAPVAVRITQGSWEVGVDVPAGKYKVAENIVDTGGMGCSGTVKDAKGNIVDIVYVKGGRPTVTLRKGYTFETADCPDWIKVG